MNAMMILQRCRSNLDDDDDDYNDHHHHCHHDFDDDGYRLNNVHSSVLQNATETLRLQLLLLELLVHAF